MRIFEVTYINPEHGNVELLVRPGKDYDTVKQYLDRRKNIFKEYTLRELPEVIWTQYGPVEIIWNCNQVEDLCYYGTIEDMDLYMDDEGNLYGIYF